MSIYRPVQRIEGRTLHLFQIPYISGHLIHPGHQLHPGNRDTGFQHQSVIFGSGLHQRRVIKQFMPAAGSSHNGSFGFQKSVRKPDHRLLPMLIPLCLGINQKAFKTGHKLIGLHHRILIRVQSVLIGCLEDVKILRPAAFYDFIGKIQIPFLRFQQIEPHYRLQNGAGIDSPPVVGSPGNFYFSLSVSHMRNDIIQMPSRCLQDFSRKGLLFTDFAEMNHPQKHILPAPHIPSAEFCFPAVSGNPAVRLLGL